MWCRNRIINSKIQELERGIEYWQVRSKEGWKPEIVERYIMPKKNAIRRMTKLKK